VSDGLNLFNQVTYQYRFYSDVTSVTYYAASTAVGAANYRLGVYDFMAVDTTLPESLYQEGFIQLPLMASSLVIYHSLNISSTLVRTIFPGAAVLRNWRAVPLFLIGSDLN